MQSETSYRKRSLLIAFAAVVIVFILWNLPQLDVLLYPFRLFVTFVHESGHGLAAILTGGSFVKFTVYGDGSGVATTIGGSRALILPAGYLGAALFGAVLFYLTHTVPYPRHISVGLGGLVILIAVVFGGIFAVATVFGVLIGLALIAIGVKANREINLLALNMLATLTALNAVLDVFFLVGNSGAGVGNVRNDAAAFQREVAPLIPTSLIALFWSALAVAMLLAAVYFSVIRPLRRRMKGEE
jgi:hypothetical protein